MADVYDLSVRSINIAYSVTFDRDMTALSRAMVRCLPVVSTVCVSGISLYIMKAFFRAQEETNEPRSFFSGFGPKSLRVQNIQAVNHNTKRVVFTFPDQDSQSGLYLTCTYN